MNKPIEKHYHLGNFSKILISQLEKILYQEVHDWESIRKLAYLSFQQIMILIMCSRGQIQGKIIRQDYNNMYQDKNKSEQAKNIKTQSLQPFDVIQENINQQKLKIESEYFLEYQKQLAHIECPKLSPFNAKFFQEGINYHPNWLCSGVYTQFPQNQMFFRSIIPLTIHFSYFSVSISVYVINNNADNYQHLDLIGSGAFGSVYQKSERKAIKVISFKQKKKQSVIKTVLKEYCIYKIASVLQIGPKVINQEFDIIIYHNCIQFVIQKCEKPQDNIEQDILYSLKILHCLNIIHGDVKVNNIMYSQTLKKNVLIDFNCSISIQQQPGFKTFTNFRGTPTNSYVEMRQLWRSNSQGYADLYYNDIYGLKQSLKQTDISITKVIKNKKNPNLIEDINNTSNHLILRKYIYDKFHDKIILQFLAKSKFLFVPTLGLTMRIKKKAESNIEVNRVYHGIYERIIYNINITAQILQKRNNPRLVKVFYDIFNEYMLPHYKNINKGLQMKFALDTRQKLIFQNPKLLKDGMNTSYDLLRKIRAKQLNIFPNLSSMYQYQCILQKISFHASSKSDIRKLYCKLLQIRPDNRSILKALQIIQKRFQFLFLKSQNHSQNLIFVNKLLYGNTKNIVIWKKVNQSSQNFIEKLILKLIQIKTTDQNFYFYSYTQLADNKNRISGLNQHMQVSQLIEYEEELKQVNYPQKQFKFLERTIYRLIQICELQVKRLKLRQDLYKIAYKCYKQPYIISQIEYFDKWINFTIRLKQMPFFINFSQKQHKYQFLNTSIIKSTRKQCEQLKKQIESAIYCGNIKETNIVQKMQKLKYLESNEFSHLMNSINFSSILFKSLTKNTNQNSQEIFQIRKFLQHQMQQYFCKINLSQISSRLGRVCLVLIHQFAFSYVSQNTIARQKLIQKLITWTKIQIDSGHNCQKCLQKLCIMMQIQGKSNLCSNFINKILDVIDIYQVLQDRDQLEDYINLISQKWRYSSANEKNKDNIQIEVIIYQLIQKQIFPILSYMMIVDCLFYKGRCQKIFEIQNVCAIKSQVNYESALKYFCQICSYQDKKKYYYCDSEQKRRYRQSFRKFLFDFETNDKFNKNMCFAILSNLYVLILDLRSLNHSKILNLEIEKLIQRGIIIVLKNLPECCTLVKQQCFRFLIRLIFCLFEITDLDKYFDIFTKIPLFQMNKYIKMSIFKVNVIAQRNSYERKKCDKKIILRKVKHKIVRKKIKQKIKWLQKSTVLNIDNYDNQCQKISLKYRY